MPADKHEHGAQLPGDRDSRIVARRKRIQDKLTNLRQGDAAGNKEGSWQQELTKAQKQILESQQKLARLKFRTQDAVTAVRVAADQSESAHRHHEEQIRKDLRAAVLAEAEASAVANTRVAGAWGSLFQLEVPQLLFQALEQQRAACEAVIASKDALVADIRAALKAKDEEYVRLLKRQAEDLDSLLATCSAQLAELTAAYREELASIEAALLQERQELLDSNRKEVAALLDTRRQAEQDFTENYLAAVEKYQADLEQLRVADTEEYQVLKIKLETDIASLEQHLETMRAAYQLNAEKLEYNYRVLRERDAENTATIAHQKRQLSRQHDVVLGLKQRYAGTDAKHAEDNSKLTDEYRRITEQFKDLQAKFRHFDRIDSARYSELWELKQSEASELTRQLLAADRVITEQQLGWDWKAPDDALFVSPHDIAHTSSSNKGAVGAAGTGTSSGTTQPASQEPSSSGVAEGSPEQQASSQAGAEGEEGQASTTGGSRTSPGTKGSNGAAEVAARLHQQRYLGALTLLVDEAGFLLDGKTQSLIDQLPVDEAGLIAAESIVRSLGVTDGAGFEALMDALTDGSADCTLVHPDDAIPRLRAFVEAESAASGPNSQLLFASALTSGKGSTSMASGIGSSSRSGAGRLGSSTGRPLVIKHAAAKEQEYWHQLTQAVDDSKFRVWCALEAHLSKYHQLLLARSEELQEVGGLAQQNEELRGLLNQYLKSKINTDLKIPPTAVL